MMNKKSNKKGKLGSYGWQHVLQDHPTLMSMPGAYTRWSTAYLVPRVIARQNLTEMP